jgi:uncharacterized membrane protein (DUF485 family)
MAIDLLLLAASFVAGILLATAFGAVNLGVALGMGQLTFCGVLVWVLLRRA